METSQDAFVAALEQYRRELQLHCYRMLGSIQDAEDMVQETALRAWRKRDDFEGRSTFRAWLYRIATNACLDAREHSSRRLTVAAGVASDLLAESPHLSPYADARLDEVVGPDDAAVERETIELTFLAAMQHLPPRQRAALILRDVLGWTAAEAADALDVSVASANSLVQRARATLQRHRPAHRSDWSNRRVTDAEREVLRRYMDAHERADAGAVIALLGESARITMPPEAPYIGRERAVVFFTEIFGAESPGEWRMVATAANRQPAAANYLRRPGETTFRALSIDVLRIEDGRLVEVNCFFGESLFPPFGLPLVL
jgi:RNA polymerase sigma-70 factor (TIGR02960 family)